MRRTMRLTGAIAASLWTIIASAATITLDPPVSVANSGETFTVQLIGQDFTDATIGGGVDVLFDASIVQVVGVTFGASAFDFAKTVNGIDNSPVTGGRIDSILVSSLLTDPIGTFNIASIEFMAIAVGVTPLALGPSTFPAPWLTLLGEDIDPVFDDGSVTVIPLPAAVGLMLSGLGILGGMRRRGAGQQAVS